MDKEHWLKIVNKAATKSKHELIVSSCTKKNVLDVGCVGQDYDLDNKDWLHEKIKKVAAQTIGVDITIEKIKQLNKNGYTIYTPEELSGLNKKFDVIVMGDVIEHVENPGDFLTFYSRFLTEKGKLIICTPNAFGIRYFIQLLLYKNAGTNHEHTQFFDPYVMLELFKRVNLTPVEFYWLDDLLTTPKLSRKIIYLVCRFFYLFRKYFQSNFAYIVKKDQ